MYVIPNTVSETRVLEILQYNVPEYNLLDKKSWFMIFLSVWYSSLNMIIQFMSFSIHVSDENGRGVQPRPLCWIEQTRNEGDR